MIVGGKHNKSWQCTLYIGILQCIGQVQRVVACGRKILHFLKIHWNTNVLEYWSGSQGGCLWEEYITLACNTLKYKFVTMYWPGSGGSWLLEENIILAWNPLKYKCIGILARFRTLADSVALIVGGLHYKSWQRTLYIGILQCIGQVAISL